MVAILILDILFYDVFLECQHISIRILLSMFISVRQHSFKINEEYHNGSYIFFIFLWPNPKYNDLFESKGSQIATIKKDIKKETIHKITLYSI